MRSIRIHVRQDGVFEIDVVCSCGLNGLENANTKEHSFRHAVQPEQNGEPIILQCKCGNRYRLRPQPTHVHVETV
jgi:hypothetical protein